MFLSRFFGSTVKNRYVQKMFSSFNLFSIFLLSCLQFSYLLKPDTFSSGSKSKILSRNRRYIAFPEGSSFSTAGCMTIGVIGQPAPSTTPGVFTFGLNWAISYLLPNSTETAQYYHSYKRKVYKNQHIMLKRKYRRDLYGKLETIMNSMGYNGRNCILKTLCETNHRLIPGGNNMIEEMFRILFTLPPTKVLPTEPLEHSIYDAAHRLGHILDECDRYKCPISLVDLMKGYYNAPSPTVDLARTWSVFE